MAPSTVSHGIFKAPLFDTDPLPDVSASHLRLPLAEYPQPASNGTTLNAEPLNQQVDGHQADSEDSDDGAPGPSSAPVQGSSRRGAAASQRTSSSKKPCNFWKNEKPRHRVQGGRSAVAKKVKPDLDSEDEIIREMKLKGHKDPAIQRRLINENRISYQEKSISTRWSRIQKVLFAKETQQLDEELSDWHEGDDDVLDYSMGFHRKQYENEKMAADHRYWKNVAITMKEKMNPARFSMNACRDRHEARKAGTAQKPLELDSDQEGRMKQRADRVALREQQRAEAAAKAAVEAEEARRIQEAKDLEEQERVAKRAEKAAQQDQKHADKQSAKDQRDAEHQQKAELKEKAQAEKQREWLDKEKSKYQSKRQELANKAAKKAARDKAAIEQKRRKAEEDIRKQNNSLAEKEKKLKAMEADKLHDGIMLEAFGDLTGKKKTKAVPDELPPDEEILSRRKRGAKKNSNSVKQKGKAGKASKAGKTSQATTRADNHEQDDDEGKPEDMFLVNGGVPAFPAPVLRQVNELTEEEKSDPSIAARMTMNLEQLDALVNLRDISSPATRDKPYYLRKIRDHDKVHKKAQVAEWLKDRSLSSTGTKAKMISRLAEDDAGLLGDKGSDFHQKIIAQVSAKHQERVKSNKRSLPAGSLSNGPSHKIQKINARDSVKSGDARADASPNASNSAPTSDAFQFDNDESAIDGGIRPDDGSLAGVGAHIDTISFTPANGFTPINNFTSADSFAPANGQLQVEGFEKENVEPGMDAEFEMAPNSPSVSGNVFDHFEADSSFDPNSFQ